MEFEIEQNKPLVYWIYSHKFKEYSYLKDDLISWGLYGLWIGLTKVNENYSQAEKREYLFKSVYHEMLDFVLIENKHKNNISLHKTLKNDTKKTLIDLIPANNDFLGYLSSKDIVDKVLQDTNKRDAEIIRKWLGGRKQVELKLEYGLSKQSISLIINTLKNKIKELIIRSEYGR